MLLQIIINEDKDHHFIDIIYLKNIGGFVNER